MTCFPSVTRLEATVFQRPLMTRQRWRRRPSSTSTPSSTSPAIKSFHHAGSLNSTSTVSICVRKRPQAVRQSACPSRPAAKCRRARRRRWLHLQPAPGLVWHKANLRGKDNPGAGRQHAVESKGDHPRAVNRHAQLARGGKVIAHGIEIASKRGTRSVHAPMAAKNSTTMPSGEMPTAMGSERISAPAVTLQSTFHRSRAASPRDTAPACRGWRQSPGCAAPPPATR